jgi:hypothetical protein
MPAKTSKSLPLLCVLLALAIGLAGWSALSGSDEVGPAALEDANHAAAPTPQAPSSPTIAALPKAEREPNGFPLDASDRIRPPLRLPAAVASRG